MEFGERARPFYREKKQKTACSRASTRKICPKRGPRKSHEKATKKPRKSNEKGPNTVFLDRRGPRKSHEKTTKKPRKSNEQKRHNEKSSEKRPLFDEHETLGVAGRSKEKTEVRNLREGAQLRCQAYAAALNMAEFSIKRRFALSGCRFAAGAELDTKSEIPSVYCQEFDEQL